MIRDRIQPSLLAIILGTTLLLGLGVFGPCLEIVPGFGDYSPLVRVLKPDLTVPTRFSLYSGITHMAEGGNWWLAALVFAFSVLFPVAKVSVYWIAANDTPKHPTFKKAFRLATQLGKFSMVDVFVIALLVVAIKGLPGNTQVKLQWGCWCFCLSVITSLAIPVVLKRWQRLRLRRNVDDS